MEKDLPTALEKLFYSGKFIASDEDSSLSVDARLKDLSSRAYSHFLRAEQSQKDGDWAKYGEELKNLKEILLHMKNLEK